MELRLDNLTVGYRRQEPLCTGVNLSARSGEAIAIIGSNGAGKSTLLRSIASLIKYSEGRISIDGELITEIRAEERARKIAYVSTEIIATAYITVRQVVEMGRVPYSGWAGKLSPADMAIVDKAMLHTLTTDLATRTIDTLSDGQRQRVMIARALAQTTPVLLLDEPTAFLDPENREMVIKLLAQLAVDMDKIVLYSTHEVELARAHTSMIWQMKEGTINIL